MPDFTVVQRGTDTSGRGLYATAYMWSVWDRVVAELGFEPTIVQGAWMVRNGGGAAASAGYHDGGGCFDLRVWDRTDREVQKMVRTLRRYGCAAWVRNERHGGMDPHLHFVLGSDHGLASGAAWQWQQYLAGRDGLASNGPDYHWRPDPLVTEPPQEDDVTPEQERLLKDTNETVHRTENKLTAKLVRVNKRLARANDLLRQAAKSDANVREALTEIEAALADTGEGDDAPRP